MPTAGDFLNAALFQVLFNGTMLLVGRAMLKSMKRKGRHRQAYHGWYVWVWMLSASAAALTAMPWLGTGGGGVWGFALLAGWLVGMIHGGFMLIGYRPPPLENEASRERERPE